MPSESNRERAISASLSLEIIASRLSNQQSLENISQWMGHGSIARTWRSYKWRSIPGVQHNPDSA